MTRPLNKKTPPDPIGPRGPYPPNKEDMEAPVDETWDEEAAARLEEAWKTPKGWRYWSAVNNSEVGAWYALLSFGFFLAAGLLALMMRVQLAVPENDFLSAERYNEFFTMHGTAMMFLFAVPIFEALSILLLPAFLGARDMPFPRLSAYGFWCFAIGSTFVMGSVLFGAGPKAGWFMYPPLSTDFSGMGSDIWLLGLSFIELASLAAAVELIVGVLKCRPPGMRINLMPLYAWYVLVVGGMIIFAFPPLIAGDLLFELERAFDWPFFDPERGGDPMLWQHLFWIFGHPEVYIVFLPSIAIAAMVVPTVAQRPIFGYSWIVLAAVGTGFLSFGLWVHHMYTTGLPNISLAFFSAASEAVVIPTGVQIFAFLATLLVGRVVMNVPMLFIAGSLAIFTAGGLSGVMVALAPFDWQAHDSYFIVAHLHYVLIGGLVFPVMAGVYYFYPFFTKKMMSQKLGRLSFWLAFSGFNIAFLPMHLTGLRGMPRRQYTYPDDIGWSVLNLVSTLGAFILAAGFAVFAFDLLRPKKKAPYAPRNPWNAGTLEWTAEIPAKPWGSRSIPYVTHRYPIWDQPGITEKMEKGRYYLGDAEEGLRETLVTTVLDARPLHVLRVTGPAWITIWAALFTGAAFILPTFHIYWPAAVCGAIAVACIVYWHWSATALLPERSSKPVGLGLELPVYASGPAAAGWWGMFITMLGDAAAFAGLVFGYFYFWTANEVYPPPGSPLPNAGLVALATVLLVGSWALTWTARKMNSEGKSGWMRALLGAALLAAALGGGAAVYSLRAEGIDPEAHAFEAILAALTVWLCAHLIAGAIMQAYCIAKSADGRITRYYDADIRNVTLFWHFMLPTILVTMAVLGLFPRLMGGAA